MGEIIRMTMDDGAEIAVYHAQPEGDRRGGLVLIQAIFGVTDHIRELCDEYAADGYEVLSPALFDREPPGFESDYSHPQFEATIALANEHRTNGGWGKGGKVRSIKVSRRIIE